MHFFRTKKEKNLNDIKSSACIVNFQQNPQRYKYRHKLLNKNNLIHF